MTEHSLRTLPPGVEYHRVLCRQNRQIWRGVLALILMMTGLLGFPIAANMLSAAISSARGSPLSHALALLGVALPIPWSMLIHRWLYGVSGHSLHSVVSKFRWRYFSRAVLIFVPFWLCFLALVVDDVDGINSAWFTPEFVCILAAVMLYAFAEQYAASGLAFRVGASWSQKPVVSVILGILVSGLLFVVSERSTDPLVVASAMTLGAGGAIITWRTGGLETISILRVTFHGLGFAWSRVFHRDTAVDLNLEAGNTLPPWALASFLILTFAGLIWLATRKSRPPVTPMLRPSASRVK